MRCSRTLPVLLTLRVASFGSAAEVAGAEAAPSLASRAKGAFLASLVADALSLATHYEYDATKIKQFYGKVDRYYSPGEKTGGETHGVGWGQRNFHGGNGHAPKGAGEQTDYGDYNLLMLQHLAASAASGAPVHRLSLDELLPRWEASMATWRSWVCTQTRQTLQQVRQGVPHDRLGGQSNAMSLRSAAALGYFATEDDVVHFARVAMFTHRETTAHAGAEFFSRVAFRVLHTPGLSPRAAMEQVAALPATSAFVKTKVAQGLAKADEALDPQSALSQEEFADDLALTSMARLWDVGKTEPIKVGKASPTEGTLPGAVYFIAKYGRDFASAAQANAEVGGDNAARAVAIGMVMGAALGVEGIPAALGKGHLVEWEAAEALLDQLPLVQAENVRLRTGASVTGEL